VQISNHGHTADEAVADPMQYLLEYFLLGMKPMLALKFAQGRRNLRGVEYQHLYTVLRLNNQ
jgi:hypothetical protein